MLHQSEVSVKDVERSIDRLKMFSKHNDLKVVIPAFYYSAQILMKYARSRNVKNVNYQYFSEFNIELESFVKRDLSGIKKHEKQIIDELFQITESQIFIQCLKAEMRTERVRYLQDGEDSPSDNEQKLNLSDSIIKKALFTEQKQTFPSSPHKRSPDQNQQQLFDKLLTSYKQHRIDQAYQLKEKYKKIGFQIDQEKQNLFDTIHLEYNTMIQFYHQFDLDGWIFDKEEKGVKLQYKIFEEEKQIAIRIQSQFNVQVDNFLAILTEMDLFGNYVPFCYDSKELKIISRNEKIGTSKIYIPCLTDRETYFYAAGYDRFEKNGSVFIFSKTINEDKLYQEKYGYKIPQKSDYIRLQYKFFIVQYIPITKEKAKVRLASKVDMKLNFLPQFIINLSARKFAFDYFKNIMKVNKKFEGSEWQQKVKEKPDFYNFFKKKIDHYLDEKK